MSCGGNRFECALKRKSRLTTQSDKPSNLELYNENQKRLNDLMRAREEIDNQFFRPIGISNADWPAATEPFNGQLSRPIATHETVPIRELPPRSIDCLLKESITVDDIEMNPTTVTYTPWVVPSATKFTN